MLAPQPSTNLVLGGFSSSQALRFAAIGFDFPLRTGNVPSYRNEDGMRAPTRQHEGGSGDTQLGNELNTRLLLLLSGTWLLALSSPFPFHDQPGLAKLAVPSWLT